MPRPFQPSELVPAAKSIHEAFGISHSRFINLMEKFIQTIEMYGDLPISTILVKLTNYCENINESVFMAYQAGAFFQDNAINPSGEMIARGLDELYLHYIKNLNDSQDNPRD